MHTHAQYAHTHAHTHTHTHTHTHVRLEMDRSVYTNRSVGRQMCGRIISLMIVAINRKEKKRKFTKTHALS